MLLRSWKVTLKRWKLFSAITKPPHDRDLTPYSIYCIIGKLFFVVSDDICKPQFQNTQKSVYFCTDNSLIYTAFFADFGPVDLGLTYTFCQQLHEILRTAAAAKKSVVYYCASHPHKRANSAVLLCAYMVSCCTHEPLISENFCR